MTTRTFRQKANGRLGFIYTAWYRERLLRDLRAEMDVLRDRYTQAVLDHDDTKRQLAAADKANDLLSDEVKLKEIRLLLRDKWIRRAKTWMHGLAIDDPELDSLIYMAPDVGES